MLSMLWTIDLCKLLFWTILTIFVWNCAWCSCQSPESNTETRSPSRFGDFLATIDSVAAGALSLWSYVESFAQEDCPEYFQCPDGGLPRANKLDVAVPDGCGSFGYNVDKFVAHGMTKCCHKHDLCFGKCGSKKSDCDMTFKKCLYDVCRSDGDRSKNEKVCQISAKLLYGATTLAGCSSFEQAQSRACNCAKSSGRSRRESQYDL